MLKGAVCGSLQLSFLNFGDDASSSCSTMLLIYVLYGIGFNENTMTMLVCVHVTCDPKVARRWIQLKIPRWSQLKTWSQDDKF